MAYQLGRSPQNLFHRQNILDRKNLPPFNVFYDRRLDGAGMME
jgi:hypothetical protein